MRGLVLSLVVMLGACAPQAVAPPVGEAGGSTPDASEPDDDVDGWSEPGPLEVGEVCSAYMDCLAETDADAFAEVLDQFGASGSCWEGGDADRCDTACAQGLEEVRDGYGDLVPACMLEASDEEVLLLSDRLCPVSLQSSTVEDLDADQMACAADAVMACDEDAADQVAECLFVPDTRDRTIADGVWELTYMAETWAGEMSGCSLPERFEVRIEATGESVDEALILDHRGNVDQVGECSGETGISCFFGMDEDPDTAFQLTGSVVDGTLSGFAGSKCGVWGSIEGTWLAP